MNVDLLPPKFPPYEPPGEGHQCGDCSSFSDASRFVGWCFMLGKPRNPDHGPEYIGRVQKVFSSEGRVIFNRLDGKNGFCFTPQSGASLEEKEGSGSVTRTESDKSVAFCCSGISESRENEFLPHG